MKKRIFFITFSVCLLLCAFALCANAAVAIEKSTSNEYGTVNIIEDFGTTTTYDDTSLVVLKNSDETFATYPAFYIYNGKSGSDMRLSFSKLNELTGENYSSASVIRVQVYAKARLNWTFQSCTSLIDVYLPEGVYLHYASFVGCSALESIVLPRSATQIPTDCFSGCYALKSVEIPETTKSFGPRAFQNCLSLSVIKIPEIATGVIAQDFRKITVNNLPCTQVTYIVPKGCAGINSAFSINNCKVEKIIFTGDEGSAFIADVTSKSSGNLALIEYANHCEYYYNGVHENDTNPCVINCARCNSIGVAKENPVHNEKTTISYTSYGKDGSKITFCQNEGCKHSVSVSVPALFNCLGYSASEFSVGEMAVGFTVNIEALAEYQSVTQKSVKYGVFVVSQNKLGANEVIGEDGSFATGVIQAEILRYDFQAFDLKLVGFVTNEQKSSLVAMGAYVIVSDNGQNSYHYVQESDPQDGQKYAFTSYISVAGE